MYHSYLHVSQLPTCIPPTYIHLFQVPTDLPKRIHSTYLLWWGDKYRLLLLPKVFLECTCCHVFSMSPLLLLLLMHLCVFKPKKWKRKKLGRIFWRVECDQCWRWYSSVEAAAVALFNSDFSPWGNKNLTYLNFFWERQWRQGKIEKVYKREREREGDIEWEHAVIVEEHTTCFPFETFYQNCGKMREKTNVNTQKIFLLSASSILAAKLLIMRRVCV